MGLRQIGAGEFILNRGTLARGFFIFFVFHQKKWVRKSTQLYETKEFRRAAQAGLAIADKAANPPRRA